MTKAMILSLVLVPVLSATAVARPSNRTQGLLKFQALDPAGPAITTSPGVLSTAQSGTTWFGGTVWAADSSRWEAVVGGTWTFDSGVGSFLLQPSADPAVPIIPPYYDGAIDLFKLPGLHGAMEGWTGFDNTLSLIAFFRNLSQDDPRWDPRPMKSRIAVGSVAGLGGDYSFWCGAFPGEADSLCYADGQGYGENWLVCIFQEFSYSGGSVTLSYEFYNETEGGFDYTYVIVDTSGLGDDVAVTSYSGVVDGTDGETLNLVPGTDLPSAPGPVVVRFCVASDGGYSDQDGLHPTMRGAFAVDNVTLTGGITHGPATFEGGDDFGWALEPPARGAGGEWSDIVDISTLPTPLTDCPCALFDSVLVFNAPGGNPHPLFQDNMAASPWMDLRRSGDVGRHGKVLEVSLYAHFPLSNYVFLYYNVQWYPASCAKTGGIVTSPWTSTGGVIYYTYPGPRCTPVGVTPTQIYFSNRIDPEAEQIRVGIGVLNYCRFYPACSGVSNPSPYIDNVRFGVFGSAGAPTLGLRTVSAAQDAFPTDGTLQIGSAARFDSNNLKAPNTSPEPGSAIGDTLVADAAASNSEVHVQFMIAPGPRINATGLTQWLGRFHDEGSGWYSARMDTAEQGGTRVSGRYMTAFHEADPGFSGQDTDLGPDGGLANDMFADDLFTPGTRINYFFKIRNVGTTSWYTFPDTTALDLSDPGDSPNTTTSPGVGGFREYEVLPSSIDTDSTWNCVLYVDHFSSRLAQPFLESALGNLLTGGSTNFDNYAWDRYDVEAPSSTQASFGRPLNTTYGADVSQVFAYKAILWNSGNLDAAVLTKEDGDVLLPWLGFPDAPLNGNALYLSGNGIASSMTEEGAAEPSARALLEDYCGVIRECSAFREVDCPAGSALSTARCVNLDPVGGARAADNPVRTSGALAQGNGCPTHRQFDVLRVNSDPLFGTALGDESYDDGAGKTADYASITNDANEGGVVYRTVVDGVSPHYRRDVGSACAFAFGTNPVSVEERLNEVLSWFGYTGAAAPCSERGNGVGIEDGIDPEPSFRTGLARFAPNPLFTGATGRIQFTLAREGRAKLVVFDVNGRLVKTVFEGLAEEGPHEASWDGRDASGRSASSGVYFIRMSTLGQTYRTKVVLIENGGR